MADKWYRIPIANSVVKVSSIEYVTPVVRYSNTNHGFRVVYNNYTSIPVRVARSGQTEAIDPAANAQYSQAVIQPSGPIENGFNATVMGANVALLESIRTDLINVLTDNGVNLINNFPDV